MLRGEPGSHDPQASAARTVSCSDLLLAVNVNHLPTKAGKEPVVVTDAPPGRGDPMNPGSAPHCAAQANQSAPVSVPAWGQCCHPETMERLATGLGSRLTLSLCHRSSWPWLLGAPVGGILNLVPTPCRGPHLISSSMASSCSCSIRARVCASERLPGETVSVGPVGPLGPSSSTSETSGSLSKAGAAAGARTPGSGHGSQSLAEKEEGAVRNPAGAAAGTSPGSASGVRSCGPRRPLGAESAL